MTRTPTRARAANRQPTAIVVEGDSWEHLPHLGLKALPTVGGSNHDLARALADRGHPVHNLAYWGDTLAEIVEVKAYLPALRETKAPVLLLGGGGNDLLGEGRLKLWLAQYQGSRPVAEYLLPAFHLALQKVMLDYEIAFNDILADPAIAGTRILIHGYDYAKPMRLGWIGEPMAFHGIDETKPELQAAIVKLMIDHVNRAQIKLARRYATVTHVDLRGIVGERWHDELHPRKEAFVDLAAKVSAKAR